MKFTIERRALVKMLELVRIRDMPYHRLEAEVKLSACIARVFVATSGMVAGHEALVFADGECFLPGKRFLKLLKSYRSKKNLTIEIDKKGLHIGNFTTAVRAYSPVTHPPARLQVFPVTDLKVLTPEQQPAPLAAPPSQQPEPPAPPPPPPPPVPHTPGTFPIADEDMSFIAKLAPLTRRLCALPKIQPEQLAGLAHALFALERLPRITQGVDVEFTLGVPSETKESYPLMLHISDTSLAIGVSFSPDTDPQIDYEVRSNGYRSTNPGEGFTRELTSQCPDGMEQLLDENSPGLQLCVTDASAPGFMSRPSNKRNPPPRRSRR